MKKFWQKHKFLSVIIILVVVIGGYYGYKKMTTKTLPARYILSAVSRDTLISTVTESGQTAASNQIDIKPKVSGDVTAVLVTSGQSVKSGQLLFKLDSTDAAKSVRDAQISLKSAQISLDKLKRGALASEIQNNVLSVETAQKNIATYQANLGDIEAKADNDLANVYSDTKNILQDNYNKTDDILNRQLSNLFNDPNSINPTLTFQTLDTSAQTDAQQQRVTARDALAKFKSAIDNITSDNSSLDSALVTAGDQLTIIQTFLMRLSDATNSGVSSASFPPATLQSYQSTVNNARSSIISSINSISGQIQAIASQKLNNKNSISDAETKISDSQTALTNAQNSLTLQEAPADPLDLQNSEISVQQKKNALSDAESTYADYSIRAPFDGILSTVGAKVGDPASSGSALATIITPQQIAEVTANEVDTAKIKIGDKATMTFDALPDLSVSGVVQEIDTVGTVSQGVVSYSLKITFDVQSTDVKPGMTVSADIITDAKPNVLVVPNSSIKSLGTSYYVEMIDNPIQPAAGEQGVTTATSTRQQFVQIGGANDNETEITSGLNEGDQIVTKTIAAGTVSAATSATSATTGSTAARTTGATAAGGAAGGGSAAGGLFRMLGR